MKYIAIATLCLLPSLAWAQDPPKGEQGCFSPAAANTILVDRKFEVRKLEGDELKAFNEAFTKEYHHAAPPTDLLLMVERGNKTMILSFAEGCMIGEGSADTEQIHRLLNAQ